MDMNQLYEQIAKEHGVSAQEVKRDMQEAVNQAYKGGKLGQVPSKNEVASVEEIVSFAVQKLINMEGEKKV